jgi:quercetin dioxygenase-like cupin family protein
MEAAPERGKMSISMWNRHEPHDAREGLFGGHGRVLVWNLVPHPQAPFAAVLACELEPGASVGAHVQEHFPELVIGVEGVGTVEVNGVASEFGAGRAVELPLGQTLAVQNDSATASLRYLIVKARMV